MFCHPFFSIFAGDQSQFYSSPLHLATMKGKLDLIDKYLRGGFNINEELTVYRNCKITPIYCAMIPKNRLKVTNFLIARGANINHKCNDISLNFMPLAIAIYMRYFDVVEVLVLNGANLNDISVGVTPLILALMDVKKSNLKIVKFLIEKGADVNVKDIMGWAPIFHAVHNSYFEAVEVLLDNSADINVKTNNFATLLHIAVDRNNLKIVKMLLKKGADCNAFDITQTTPLHIASCLRYNEIAAVLINYGANIHLRDINNNASLHFACLYGNLKIVKMLIQYGADVNSKGFLSLRPLHLCAAEGHTDILRLLLMNGAYFDVKDEFLGLKPTQFTIRENGITRVEALELLLQTDQLFEAIKKNNELKVRDCLAKGVPVNSGSIRFKTPLMHASWKGHINIVNRLLENDAKVNFKDEKNSTALHYAVKFNHVDVVYSLLKHDAMFDVRTSGGKTPADFALKNNDIDCLLRLIAKLFEEIKSGDCKIVDKLKKIKTENYKQFLAIVNARNNEGKTLIHTAFINNHEDITKSLISIVCY